MLFFFYPLRGVDARLYRLVTSHPKEFVCKSVCKRALRAWRRQRAGFMVSLESNQPVENFHANSRRREDWTSRDDDRNARGYGDNRARDRHGDWAYCVPAS